MLIKKMSFAAFLLSLVAASTAFAADTGNTRIVRIAPWSNGTQIQTDSGNSCNNTAQLSLGSGTAVMDRNFDLAVAAMLSGRQVNINYSCSGTTANIISIRLL